MSLKEVLIIRVGTDLWVGVAVGTAAIGLTVKNRYGILPRLALLAPFVPIGLPQNGIGQRRWGPVDSVAPAGERPPRDRRLAPLAAFLGGVLSITSPFYFPLLPGHVGFLGSHHGDPSDRRVLGEAVLFVAGFTIVFTALGATATALGSVLLDRLDLVSGVGNLVSFRPARGSEGRGRR